jgi:hypothetical protein
MDKLSKLRARISDLAKEEVADAIKFRAEVLAHARRGDWHPLALYLRGRGAVTREVRSLMSEILLGKHRPKGKVRSKFATERLKIGVATFVLGKRLRGEKNAVALAAKEFKKTERTILRYLAEGGKFADQVAIAFDEPRYIERADVKDMMWQVHRGDKTMLHDIMRTPEHHGSPDDI